MTGKTKRAKKTRRKAKGFSLYHGAAWYPELWRDRIDEDIALMREAGINLVRVGEFAWSSMEPSEGRYSWKWLSEALDACHAAGISVMLCTPTPTPPLWLTRKYPDVLRVDIDGKPFRHGSRQHVSHVSKTYRAHSRRITRELAKKFGRHPALMGWQTDNEFLCHVRGDFSGEAVRAWQAWLKARYGTIRNLNETWGTYIWSENYGSFAQVPAPGKTPFHCASGSPIGKHHVSLCDDWSRFTSDTVVAFQREQIKIIRQHSDAPITHNQVSFERLSSEALFEDLDMGATDVYASQPGIWGVFRRLDLLRGLKMDTRGNTVPYMVLETSASHNGATVPSQATHPNGFLPAEAMLFLGMGGNAVCYWPWRQQRSGVEMCHGSVITSWGTPSVGWQNVRQVSALMKKLEPVLAEYPPMPAELAVHDSFDSSVHLLDGEQLWKGFNIWGAPTNEIYRPLLERGIWRDHRTEGADISRYKVVLSPFMPIIRPDVMDRMMDFVRAGGLWIVGPMSGVRTEHGTVHTNAGLGALDDFAGVHTLWPVGLDKSLGSLSGNDDIRLSGYCLGLEPGDRTTEVLGRYIDGPAAGAVWLTRRRVGKGQVAILAAVPESNYGTVLDLLLAGVDLDRYTSSWGTTLIPRGTRGGKQAFLAANWDGEGGTVDLPRGGIHVVSGKRLAAGRITLSAFECLAVVCE